MNEQRFLNEIQIDGRHRKNLGDLKGLAKSIEEVGLLHPIVIKPDGTLIAGERRLAAVKMLGWAEVPVTVLPNLDGKGLLIAEGDENTKRKDLLPSEAVALADSLEAGERKKAQERQKSGLKQGDKQPRGGNLPPRDKGKARDKVAQKVGMSYKTLEKARKVIQSEDEALIKEMDKTGKVNRVWKRLQKPPPPKPEEDSNITLYQGDSLRLLQSGLIPNESISLIIADPPYNVTEHEWDKIGDDEVYLSWLREWITLIKPLLKKHYHIFLFCSPQYQAQVEVEVLNKSTLPTKDRIIWHHPNLSMGRDIKDQFIATYDMVYHLGEGALNWPEEWDKTRFDVQIKASPQSNFKKGKSHPTQKPYELIKHFIALGSNKDDLVLDPFAGSGVTGEAAQDIGDRQVILIEQNPEFVKVIEGTLGVTANGNQW